MAVQGWGYQREREKFWQGWPRAPPQLFDAKEKRQGEEISPRSYAFREGDTLQLLFLLPIGLR
jgi:hypothetical protein